MFECILKLSLTLTASVKPFIGHNPRIKSFLSRIGLQERITDKVEAKNIH